MADVAEDNKVIEAVPADQVKELKEAVKEPVAADDAVPASESTEEDGVKEVSKDENGKEDDEVAPKENGTAKDEKATNGSSTNGGDADAESLKRKTEDEADGKAVDVSAEKKAKLEEKSEDGVAEAPSNGEAGVVA